MPFTRIEIFQVSLLLLCVPTQYLISKYFAVNNDSQRTLALNSLLSTLSDFKTNYLEWNSWLRWCFEFPILFTKFRHSNKEKISDKESPAVEVIKYRGGLNGYFAESLTVRSPRPRNVRYRIGQVVEHKYGHFRGVIVGWDSEAKAPQSWLYKHYPISKISEYSSVPHYLVLVDQRDHSKSQKVYEIADNLILLSNAKIVHRNLGAYFDAFDGAQYIPRDHIRIFYPDD